jgi:hypothetical protein
MDAYDTVCLEAYMLISAIDKCHALMSVSIPQLLDRFAYSRDSV